MSTELSEPKIGIAMQILLALSPSAPSPTIPELAEEFFGHLVPAKARIYISQQVWQLRARGWAIEKDGRGCLLLGREHYRLLLDWYRRRTTALGCYGVRPFTPENLKRFCEVLLEDRNHEGGEEKATNPPPESSEKHRESETSDASNKTSVD